MEGLFGTDFEIDITKTKADVKKLAKKLALEKAAEEDPEKFLKSKKLTIHERLAIINERVIKTLGSQRANTVVIKTLDDFSAYIDAAIAAGRIDIDTETNNTTDPVNSKMAGLCLYTPGQKQAYIPLNHVDVNTGIRLPWQLTEEDCRKQLQRVLDSKIKIIMHNGKFDFEVIKVTCGIEVPPDWDTIIGARLIDENLYSDKRTSLKYMYVTLIDPRQAKYDIEGLFENVPYIYVDPDIFALYAATDSMMTDKIYLWEQPFFEGEENKKLNWLANEIEMPIVTTTAKMELRGVCIDQTFGERLKVKYNQQLTDIDAAIAAELESLKTRIDEWRLTPEANEKTKMYVPKKSKMSLEKIEETYNLIDKDGNRYKETKPKTEQLADPINLASPVQLAILFYDILKCPVVNKDKPRATGEDELVAIHEKMPDLKICSLLLDRRGIVKLITTYIDVIPDLSKRWADGRIRFRLNSMGTDTGRYSSGGKWKYLDENNNAVEISGINIQNIPSHNPEIRMLFKARVDEENIQFDTGVCVDVKEITELETSQGFKFCKDLLPEDVIVFEDGTVTNIAYLKYDATKKLYSIALNDSGLVRAQTRYKIIGSDYSAQEPRLTAFVAQDKAMINAYLEGKDLYAVIAQSAFNNNYEDNLEFYPEGTEIEEDGKKIICGNKTNMNKAGKERRKVGKTLQLAATYGMSGATAGARMGKTKKEGEALLESFFSKFTGVRDTIAESKEFLKKNGYVEDWAGRRRHLPEINFPAATARYKESTFDGFNPIIGCESIEKTEKNDPILADWASKIKMNTPNKDANKIVQEAFKANPSVIISLHTGQVHQAERQCFNARIQGGAASLTKLAMLNIDRDPLLNELDAHLIITVHDEVLVECPALYADEVEKRLPQIMIDTAKPYINVPMKCDPYNVTRWYCDEAAVAIKEEYKKLEKKGVPAQIAAEQICKNHVELDEQVILNVLHGNTETLEF